MLINILEGDFAKFILTFFIVNQFLQVGSV